MNKRYVCNQVTGFFDFFDDNYNHNGGCFIRKIPRIRYINTKNHYKVRKVDKYELLYKFKDVQKDRFILLFESDNGYMVSSNVNNEDICSSAKKFYFDTYEDALDKFNRDRKKLINFGCKYDDCILPEHELIVKSDLYLHGYNLERIDAKNFKYWYDKIFSKRVYREDLSIYDMIDMFLYFYENRWIG